ncbi:MAG: YcjX family protein [Planctomycetia bacterium]|nr:YcjX family protein [Planctomycetia bacterium]
MSGIIINNPLTRNFFGCNRSIGVVGLGLAGKTVFLTSLIDHLRNHNPERYPSRFDLENKRVSEFSNLVPPRSDIWCPFRFEEFRAQMANQFKWPERTTSCSRIDLKFKFSWTSGGFFVRKGERTWNDYYLTLYDIPGERTPDVVMYENGYAAWCELTLNSMRKYYKQYRDHAGNLDALRDYLDLAENPCEMGDDEIVRAYKLALIEMLENGCSNVTPSIFMVDDEGRRFRDKHWECRMFEDYRDRLLTRCRAGAAGAEFAPLGEKWRSSSTDEAFGRAYQRYQREYVYPLFGTLISCDALAFLVDIPTILKNGPRDLNMYREILSNLLMGLHPGDSILPLLFSLGFRHSIERIAFVATQCDRFHPDDQPTLVAMLQHLADPVCNRVSLDYRYEYFAVSAVESTRLMDDGKMHFNTPNGEAALDYWRIPSEWRGDFPNDAQSEAFVSQYRASNSILPRVAPVFSRDEAVPPSQIKLDALFRFLTQW